MLLFKTNRLVIRHFRESDSDACFDLMSNPNVMNAIPLKTLTREESDLRLKEWISNNFQEGNQTFWAAIAHLESDELVGMCAYLKNNEDQHALAYRFREQFWGNGFGTEVAEGMISFGFSYLNMELITGDAWINNKNSMNILKKFMYFVKEFPNPKDQLIDRRYMIRKSEWQERS